MFYHSAMAEWVIDVKTEPRQFPTVWHRHPNGTLRADRDRTPTVVQPLGGARTERWTYLCACGDVYLWERRA
jgi:hypothetical protein